MSGPDADPAAPAAPARYAGLDLLATAVLIVRADGAVAHANQAAEQLFDLSRRSLVGQSAARLFAEEGEVEKMLAEARANNLGLRRQLLSARRPHREPLPVQAVASALYADDAPLALELAEIGQQLKVTREERQLDQTEANRQLLRSLAHEIKNPLGGIRGAAQLLERELASAEQREFTRVIIGEVDRLQSLMDRLLVPHRHPRVVGPVNIHEVCERVRALVLAEFPHGLTVRRDYDVSIPDVRGDREQLIQALLNVVRNAAQALEARIAAADAEIVLRTRVARQVTIARQRHRLALVLQVIDNGPGIPDALKERIFYPLVSGREGGSGLGLTLAQTFIQQNDGAIEVDSRPGHTEFRILIPYT